LLHFEFILCHVFEIEFIEMGEPTVLATDRKVTTTYRYIMGTRHVTVSAFRGFTKIPDIITPNLGKCSGLSNIFNAGNKDTGRTAVVTCYLRLVWYCFYDLVCHLLTVVAIRAEFCKNEPVTHGKYWICPGSLICCTTNNQPHRTDTGSDKIIKPIVQYYTPELFDGICDIRTATFSSTGDIDKILELISVQVFRMPPFFRWC